MGDCAISNDARFMVGTFGTKYNKPRNTAVADIENNHVYRFTGYADVT
jgi:hypothetical protein